jgi:nuclear pore complex protein Nup205
LNDEFKQQAVEVADELDLDELEATKLLIQSQDEAAELDRSPTASAIIRFHKRRQFLLECLRLVIAIAQGDEDENEAAFAVIEIKRKIVNVRDNQVGNGSKYWQKCFEAMQGIEAWLHRLADRQQRVSIIGHSLSDEALELLDFESASLLQQHESLSCISAALIKDHDGYSDVANFRALLGRVRIIDKHDLILVHYLPTMLAFIVRYGDADAGHCTPEQAGELNKIILAEKETEHWALRNFHAAIYVWWSSEYFSHFKMDGAAAEKRENDEIDRFSKALADGAFHFMLSVAADTRKPDWYDPAKAGLIGFLLQDAVSLTPETAKPSGHFQRLLMDQLQLFVDAFITNMPNTLRNLKNEEDKQRRELLARFQKNAVEYQYHLERFLVLLSLAYEDSPEGAIMFWEDTDGNLYGFLQWAAKRQTTPRVAAFCEMLGALAENAENASSAHQFLLEEGSPVAGKLRRTGSLSWNQIYAEIFFYAKTIRDRPAPVPSAEFPAAPGQTQDVVEPESAMMLECYLRLVTQLCRHSEAARTFVLEWQHENLTLRDILFQLASSQIDSRLRACAFTTLSSLLTNKKREESDTMWTKLDQWIAGGAAPASNQPSRAPARPSPSWSEQVIFETIAAGFEESNSFLGLLNGLISASRDELGLNDSLPYPENLGSAYRLSGMDSYVDFAVGKAFGDRTAQLTDQIQLRLLRLSALDFIATCLSTFNEDLVVVANRSSFPVDAAMHTSSLEAYVRLHPFARVMEWLFNDKVLTALFATAHQDINEVNAAANDSPYILSLVRSVEVMNLIMKLQPTYIDIVRPLIKSKAPARRIPIAHSAIASFEDALLNNLHIVVDLGLYCGTGHQELTLASLSLLEKLSSSKKLVVSPAAGFGKYSDRSKLIGVYEQNDDAERVARSLMSELRIDGRELEGRQLAPGYIIKASILSFLKNCLSALPDRPTLAHLLLGFICRVRELEIGADSLIAQGTSLFHAIVTLAVEYPEVGPVPPNMPYQVLSDDQDGQIHPNAGLPSYFAWLSNIREACMEILSILWKSPISNVLVMNELRSIDFIFAVAMRQGIISPNTLWDGVSIRDELFLYTDSAIGFRNFLRQRTAFYDYLARELRVAASQKMNGLRERLQGTILGQTKFPGQDPLPNPNIFDLFDFMELDVPSTGERPPWENFADLDFEVCRFEGKGSLSPYDIASAQELMLLRRNEVMSAVAVSLSVPSSHQTIADQLDRARSSQLTTR